MKYQFNTGHLLPAGGSDSRERGCREPKAPNDKSGSLHLGTIHYVRPGSQVLQMICRKSEMIKFLVFTNDS